jgi:uncharacterized protein YbcC (UPF0753/DUF2309 family)
MARPGAEVLRFWGNSREVFMSIGIRTTLTVVIMAALGAAGTSNLLAQEHVVSTADLQSELSKSAATRQGNLVKVRNFLSSEPVRKALKSAKIDEEKVEKAVPSLSDEELARLAKRTDNVQRDMAAGTLSNEQLTYIVIALATAVLVIIIVER